MLIIHGTVHTMDGPAIDNGFVAIREGKIWKVGPMEECPADWKGETLDDAVNAYEQAVGLKNFCEKKLQEAKLKIEKIVVAPDGTPSLTPLDKNDD